MNLQIALLGPLELRRDGTSVNPGGPTQRAVLAMLALHPGEPVADDQLLDGIWGEADGSTAGARMLWTHVSRLRAVLGGSGTQPLARVTGGYRLVADHVSVDAHEFERLLRDARRQLSAGNPGAASVTLGAGLALWRGPALMDLRDFPFAASSAARYEEQRIEAAEERIEARLALGEDAALIPELQSLIAEQPFRERLHGQLMVALYRAGQQAAALDAYRAARTRLAVELGIEPGPELQELQRAVLEQREIIGPRGAASVEPRQAVPARPPRRRVPAPPVLFGRERLLGDLQELAAETHLLTLTGTGGAGKTSLASALFERLEPEFDGSAFVDLGAQATPKRLLPALASALGISRQAGSLAAQLGEFVADRRMLILLDGAEHALDAMADLAPIVEVSRGLIVATSRRPLRLSGEFVADVPPLPVPAAAADPAAIRGEPSVQLFLHAAAAAGGEVGDSPEDLEAVAAICRAVDGLPLALQISAAQTRTEGVVELAATLAARLATLPSRSINAPARQHTMDSAIGWSIQRLAPRRRVEMARLSTFAGSFTALAAGTVLGLAASSTRDVLADLLDASLLIRRPALEGAARFRMLEPIRDVVRARASSELMAESAARHAAFIRADVDRLCPVETGIRRPADLALLRAEHDDLMAALWHLADSEPDACIDLASQLEDYWYWTGQENEAMHVAEVVMRADRLSTRAQCLALGTFGSGAFMAGELEAWRTLRDRVCDLASQVSEDAVLARVRLSDARFCFVAGEEARGAQVAHAAVTHARRAGGRRTLAFALATLAFFEPRSDGLDPLALLEEAQEIAAAERMRYTELWATAARAVVHGSLGRLPESIALYRSVLDIAREFDAPAAVNLPAANLAVELLRTWSTDEARTMLLSALRTADHAGHRIWASVALQELGEVEASVGRWAGALTLLAASRALVERMGMTGLYSRAELARYGRMERYLAELLGRDRAAAVTAHAEEMTYREAVDFAIDASVPANQVPSAAPGSIGPVDSIASAVGATSGAGAPSSR